MNTTTHELFPSSAGSRLQPALPGFAASLGLAAPRLPAAVVQASAHPKMSERYVHINTSELLPVFRAAGFEVSAARTFGRQRPTVAGDADAALAHLPFRRHQVELRMPSLGSVHGAIPRILVENAHDGSRSLRLMMGLYRFVCSNGLVVGSTLAQETIRHSGEAAAQVIERVRALARNTQATFDQVDRWTKIAVPKDAAAELARLVGVLRWGDAERFSPELLLSARREEDAAPDLWSVFNRIQENTVRGGFRGLTRSGRASTARPLNDDTAYNAQLWELTEDFAEMLTT